jgi:2-methylcitrate dehydratase
MKSFPTEALTHAPISAVLDLVKEHDLAPDAIQEVRIRSLARAADILADPSKYDPRTKETADHSLPYCIAAAIVDRRVTPEQFDARRIMDATIRAQLPKVKVVADPEIEAVFPRLQRVHVTIVTADGRELAHQLDYPKGDPRNPMTDDELDEKFAALAGDVCSTGRIDAMREAIRRAEEFERLSDLMEIFTADEYSVPCKEG